MLYIRVIMHDQGPWRHKEAPHRHMMKGQEKRMDLL